MRVKINPYTNVVADYLSVNKNHVYDTIYVKELQRQTVKEWWILVINVII